MSWAIIVMGVRVRRYLLCMCVCARWEYYIGNEYVIVQISAVDNCLCVPRFMNAFMFEETTVMNVLSSVKNMCVGVCADL